MVQTVVNYPTEKTTTITQMAALIRFTLCLPSEKINHVTHQDTLAAV